jgi:hypothetical protein
VWDLSTGRAATVAIPDGSSATSSGGGPGFLAWEQDGKLTVLNLPKIK